MVYKTRLAEDRRDSEAKPAGYSRDRCGTLLNGADEDPHGQQQHRFHPGGHAR
jgi:hypothetical protein